MLLVANGAVLLKCGGGVGGRGVQVSAGCVRGRRALACLGRDLKRLGGGVGGLEVRGGQGEKIPIICTGGELSVCAVRKPTGFCALSPL